MGGQTGWGRNPVHTHDQDLDVKISQSLLGEGANELVTLRTRDSTGEDHLEAGTQC